MTPSGRDGDGGPDDPRVPGGPRDEGREPVDVETAWADIVARWGEPPPDADAARRDLDAESAAREATERGSAPDDGAGRSGAAGPTPSPGPAAAWRGGTAASDGGSGGAAGSGPGGAPAEDPEDHYTPPEPAPAPEGDLVGRLAWVGALAGPALLLVCVLLWRDAPTVVVAASVVAFVAGFGVLVARLPRHHDDSGDDGAVV